MQFNLPDCEDGLQDPSKACYGVNAQPWASDGAEIGIGYSDRSAALTRRLGAFNVGRLRLRVDAATSSQPSP